MIDYLKIKNFKCFSSAEFELGKLNILAGANGTGKSSVFQAILLLYQSFHSLQLIAMDYLQLKMPPWP